MERKRNSKQNLTEKIKNRYCDAVFAQEKKWLVLKNIHTGKFEEVMLIRSDEELDVFKAMYELDDVVKEY